MLAKLFANYSLDPVAVNCAFKYPLRYCYRNAPNIMRIFIQFNHNLCAPQVCAFAEQGQDIMLKQAMPAAKVFPNAQATDAILQWIRDLRRCGRCQTRDFLQLVVRGLRRRCVRGLWRGGR